VRKLTRNLTSLTFLVLLTGLPAQAQAQSPDPSTSSSPTTTSPPAATSTVDASKAAEAAKLNQTEVEFIDSRDSYWVNRSFNDMMFGVNGGVINEAHIERNHDREEEALRKIYKPPTLVEVVIKNKKPAAPPLMINGKVIEVK
jgi:hypothetical protein